MDKWHETARQLAEGILAVSTVFAWGCGGETAKSPIDEGLAAEVLGDWEGAEVKYEAVRRAGDGEGSRKLAELTLLRGTISVFSKTPEDGSWLEEAKALRSRVVALGSEAGEKGCPVEGLEETLAKWDTRIADAEKEIPIAREYAMVAAKEEAEQLERSRNTSAVQAARAQRMKLAEEEVRLDRELGSVLGQWKKYGDESLVRQLELANGVMEYTISSTVQSIRRVIDRYNEFREPLEEQMQNYRSRLAEADRKLQGCARDFEDAERALLPKHPQ